jgi:hypothetical protein
MADDVTLPGAGAPIATDEIGGRHFQRVKLVLGADGVNDGDVDEDNPVPISAAALPLPADAATAALQSEISGKLPATLGQQTVANSISMTPATAAAFRAGAPLVGSTSVRMVQTNATGSAWAAFGSHACSALDILNQVVTSPNAAVDLRVRLNGAGEWFPLRAGGSYMVTGITNANQVEIQRSDQSNTQVEVRAVAYAA